MKRIIFIALASLLVVHVTSRGHAQTLAVHNGGRVEMGIIGRGSLAGAADGSYTAANFNYPADDPDARSFLSGYSEIWIGTSAAPIASVVDLTSDSRLASGEWNVASFGEPRVVASAVPGMKRIAARYQAKLSDTFTVLVEQESTSWDDPKTDESNGIVLKLALTNLGELAQNGVYVALATNWDVDVAIPQAGNPNLDMVQWDAQRRASLMFDGSSSDDMTKVYVASALVEGNFHAHRFVPIPTSPWTFSDEQRATVIGQQAVQEQTAVPQNYMTVLVAGPFNLVGKNTVTATFALVGGDSRDDALANVDAVRRAAFRPAAIVTEAVEGGVRVAWQAPIASDVIGYAVFRSTSRAGTYSQIGSRIVSATEFTDTSATEGTSYFYRVHAVNSAEAIVDAPSEVVVGATGPKPATVSTIRATVGSGADGTVVKITFDATAGDAASKVALYRNETGDEPWTLIQMLDYATSLTDAEVTPGKTYYYRVRLVSDVGRFGDPSDPLTVDVPTAVAPLAGDLMKIVVSPNPVHSGGVVRFSNLPPRVTIHVFTADGTRIARLDSFDAPTVTWRPDLSVASGVYLWQAQRVPEATSENADSSPENGELQSVFGKIAVLR